MREKILWLICIFLSVALYFTISIRKWGLALVGDEIDYVRFGNWSDAVSGISTTIALIIAFVGLYAQQSSSRKAEKQRQIEEETSIYIWLKHKDAYSAQNIYLGRTWDLLLYNSTKFPIYNWSVEFESYEDHLCSFQKRPLLPDENIFNVKFLDNLEPQQTPIATLYFESKSNNKWQRTSKGVLSKMDTSKFGCIHFHNPST